MYDSKKYLSRLRIFFLEVRLYDVAQWHVARLVALHDFTRRLVDNDYVVVFVKWSHFRGEIRDKQKRKNRFRRGARLSLIFSTLYYMMVLLIYYMFIPPST